MRLTPDLVARVPPFSGETGRLAGRSDLPSDADYAAGVAQMLAGAPDPRNVWIFACGSLIWNPEVEVAEERLALAPGWRRSFCIGWMRIYRGTPERPGIMMGLDRGGSCRGVAFRLPADAVEAGLDKLLRREMPLKRAGIPARWISVRTEGGPLRAIAFPVNRSSPAYLPGLTEDTVATALATACGERGSMAEYLHSTIVHLEQRGIHDAYLWRLQAMVAERIEHHWPAPPAA
jgi:cation transport protein ChaC